jgi:hypothetical protein
MAGLRLEAVSKPISPNQRRSKERKKERKKEESHTSMLLKTFPFHSFCHSLAFLPLRNFIKTMYRFAREVRIIRKWQTSSRVFSPTKPKKSEPDR